MKKIKFYFLYALIFSILQACNTENCDPAKSFEKIVKSCHASLVPLNGNISKTSDGDEWLKTFYSPYDVSYTAEKTNSIIMPYIGKIQISYESKLYSSPKEELLKEEIKLPSREVNLVFHSKIRYIVDLYFKDCKWFTKKVTYADQSDNYNEWFKEMSPASLIADKDKISPTLEPCFTNYNQN